MVALNCQNTYQNACYDAKNWTNRTWSEFFYDGWKFRRQCVNVIDITWGRIYFSMCKNFGLSVQWPLMTRQRDVVVVRTALTAAMVVPSTMFKVYDPPNSETLVSKLFQNFPVINMTWEAVHIKFLIRKLVFTIIPIAHEGSNILISHLFRMIVWTLGCTFSQEPVIIWPESKPLYSAQV